MKSKHYISWMNIVHEHKLITNDIIIVCFYAIYQSVIEHMVKFS